MRNVILALVVAVCCGAVVAAENEAGLVLHYSFDKSADSTLRDKSGSENHGQILGGTRWVKGEFGSALEFNGTDGYIDCGAKPSLNIGKAGTIAFWFKPKTRPQGGLVAWTAGDGSRPAKKGGTKSAIQRNISTTGPAGSVPILTMPVA
jgi:hypothetical protein